MITSKLLQDHNGHSYNVPNELEDTFRILLAGAESGDHTAEQNFLETFGGFRTSGDINYTED